MISIIVCSINEKHFNHFSDSVKSTVGVDYEIIRINNTIEKLSIAKAYNKGLSLAKFDIALFIHEDVLFKTTNWGSHLVNCFSNNPQLGCLGIAGGLYKTKAPSHWCSFAKYHEYIDASYLIQHYRDGSSVLKDTWPQQHDNLLNVIFLDGVFLAIDKRTGLQFNESIAGFHGYDLYLSMQAIEKGYKNYATRNILIEHLSSGSFNSDWIKTVHQFNKQYRHRFPLRSEATFTEQPRLEKETLAKFVEMSFLSRAYKIGFYWWLRLFCQYPLYRSHKFLSEKLLESFRNKKALVEKI
jgi:glycosyltransferase involved in cell wall biosynthesis